MCGVFGWDFSKGNITAKQTVALAAMLANANDNRGGDSYGFWGDRTGVIRGLKYAKGDSVHMADNRRLMGHTRKATQGAPTIENAHPFLIGKVLGAHNGIITNHDFLNKSLKRSCDVDSMHIFANLNEDKDLSNISGYGVIEYMYPLDGVGNIYLCKVSHSGDLSIFGIGKPDDYRGVVWSSSGFAGRDALDCAGVKKYFEFDFKAGDLMYVHGGKLWDAKKKLEFQSFQSHNYYHGMAGDEDWEAQKTAEKPTKTISSFNGLKDMPTEEEWRKLSWDKQDGMLKEANEDQLFQLCVYTEKEMKGV